MKRKSQKELQREYDSYDYESEGLGVIAVVLILAAICAVSILYLTSDQNIKALEAEKQAQLIKACDKLNSDNNKNGKKP